MQQFYSIEMQFTGHFPLTGIHILFEPWQLITLGERGDEQACVRGTKAVQYVADRVQIAGKTFFSTRYFFVRKGWCKLCSM